MHNQGGRSRRGSARRWFIPEPRMGHEAKLLCVIGQRRSRLLVWWSRDAASGPCASRPSDSCLGCLAGCVGWGVVLRHFVSGTPRCRRRIGVVLRRRGAVLLASWRSADAPESNRVYASILCLRTGIRVYFSTQCSPLRFFTLAAKATRSSFRCICWGTTAVSGGREA